ncbi:MAG TPA: amino acid adenylation domain-containing protein [Longimicrobiaceae bacterium]|nr:amino acid adenylation domain-containing protein [Longimicrobiaceae bacterium]
MTGVETYVDLLRWRAQQHPDRTAFRFLRDGQEETESLTYGQLDEQARRIGAALQSEGLRGERALLLFQPGLSFVAAYFGCLYAGVVAVPVYPPRLNRSLERLQAIIADAGARVVLASEDVPEKLGRSLEETPELRSLHWCVPSSLDPGCAWTDPGVRGSDLAFLQYTSGSTSRPKGVQVTHGNLLANQRMMRDSFGHSEELVVVGWLPVYHDMGLIGNVLHPVYMGGSCVLMSPTAFLQQPVRWLRAISRYGAETSGGPNFAYELCADRVTPEEKADLDLSGWNVAFCGAEPVRSRTLDRFTEALAGCGFRRRALYPCYGLAEATLFVTGGRREDPPVVRTFSGESLERERGEPCAAGEPGATMLVGCGRPWHDSQVVVVDPKERTPCREGEVGEIWVSGPHVARGYWNLSPESEPTFGGYLEASGEGPFLRTGDLGFLDEDGELFVTGRRKDLIILRGRNLYPQDLEATAGTAHPALQPGGSAAFSVDVDGEERLVLVHEVRRTSLRDLDAEEVVRAVREAIAAAHEVQAHEVVLIRPATLPKTSSGKVQRRACRQALLDGQLDRVEGGTPPGGARGGGERMDADLAVPEAAEVRSSTDPAVLEAYLRARAACVLRLPAAAVSAERSLPSLGLDSLSASDMAASVAGELGLTLDPADLLRGEPLSALARRLHPRLGEGERTPASAPRAGEPPVPGEPRPLSYGQRALWFLHRMAPESPAYNVALAVRLRGRLDAQLLEEALRRVVGRHPVLRTALDEAEPVQRVVEGAMAPLVVHDAAGWEADALRARLEDEAFHPFDLAEAPLLRARLYLRGEEESILLLGVHHVVVDFRSLEIVADELFSAYEALREGADATLPVPEPGYHDFVAWQGELLAGPEGERLRAHWSARLDGAPTVLSLPTDRPRPALQGHRGGAVGFALPSGLAGRVRHAARAEGVTPYVFLLSVFQLLLHRYSGQDDLLVGSPAAGRVHSALSGVVGYLVNPVVLRARFDGDPTFRDLLLRTREEVLSALSAQAYPFERLVEQLQPVRDSGHSPLFQVLFVLQQAHRIRPAVACALGRAGEAERRGSLVMEAFPLEPRAAQFDLTLVMGEVEGALAGSFQYDADLFDPATVERMAGHFERLLDGAVSAPEAPASRLPLLRPEEERRVLVEFTRTATRFAQGDAPLHRLFEAQAARTPEAVAVAFEGEVLTYAGLNARANRLARRLRREGVGPEVRVGVCMERSPEMVVALLAVLKAGGAYVPLDPEYPEERLRHMREDSGVAAVLTSTGSEPKAGAGAEVFSVDARWAEVAGESPEDLPGAVDPESLAYVIYTSGSTGRPKGAMNAHRGVVNRLLWMQAEYGLTPDDVVLQKTPFGFDVSVWEFFWPLLAGARLVLARPGGHRDPVYLGGVIERERVTTLHFVPPMLQAFLAAGEAGRCGSLRRVVCSGEALPPDLQQRVFEELPGVELHNLYGPTEAAVDVTYWRCGPGGGRSTVPIGRPVANTRTFVLDADLGPVPAGVPGELYIGGVQVGRGYLGRAALTAERFVPDPFSEAPGARMYRTGDRARWSAEGVLEFLGRDDHQVKIRGFRIELGEIEAALAGHPEVRECVAVAAEVAPGERRLVAYLVGRDGPPPVPELRERLQASLPEYMVPAAFVTLDALPLTPNGKVDRRALPPPEFGRDALRERYVAPRTATEEVLAGIWSEVLGVERVGVYDNFFALGGYSILAVQVASRVQREFGVALPLPTLFQAPDIDALACCIARKQLELRAQDDVEALLAELEAMTEEEVRAAEPRGGDDVRPGASG